MTHSRSSRGITFLLAFVSLCGSVAAGQPSPSGSSATEQIRARLAQNPDWQEGWWLLGSSLYDSDQYAEAAAALSHLVQLRPSAAPAWALLGLSEFEIKQYKPSLAHVEKALELGVNDQPQMAAVLRFHEALLLTHEGQFDKSLHRYSQFVPKQIADPQLLLGLGLLALRRPLLPSQIAASETPLISQAGAAMANLLTGSPDQARTEFEHLAKANPDAAGVQFALGFALFASDPDASIVALRREVAQHPAAGNAYALLSWIYFVRGDGSLALEQARIALAKDAQLSLPAVLVARDEINRGDVARALKRLDAAAQREPDNLEVHLALASAYSAAGKKAEAQRERQIAVHMRTTPVAQP